MDRTTFHEVCEIIEQMRKMTESLKKKGEGVEAVERNADRILASIKMLELNITDIKDLL